MSEQYSDNDTYHVPFFEEGRLDVQGQELSTEQLSPNLDKLETAQARRELNDIHSQQDFGEIPPAAELLHMWGARATNLRKVYLETHLDLNDEAA